MMGSEGKTLQGNDWKYKTTWCSKGTQSYLIYDKGLIIFTLLLILIILLILVVKIIGRTDWNWGEKKRQVHSWIRSSLDNVHFIDLASLHFWSIQWHYITFYLFSASQILEFHISILGKSNNMSTTSNKHTLQCMSNWVVNSLIERAMNTISIPEFSYIISSIRDNTIDRLKPHSETEQITFMIRIR